MRKSERYKIEFLPSGKTDYFESGTNILEAARTLEIELPSFCGGVGICGKCLIEVDHGVSSPSAVEVGILTEKEIAAGIRLACETKIKDSCIITIPNAQQVETSAILTTGERGFVETEPTIAKQTVVVAKPSLETNPFDLEDIIKTYGIESKSIKFPLHLLQHIPNTLRESEYQGTIVTAGEFLLDYEAGDTTRENYGVAIDIGTTTVVGKLIDLTNGNVLAVASRLNSQRAFGEDVISRIGFTNGHDDGLVRLHKKIIDLLNDIINELLNTTGLPQEHIYEIVCVGNTVMQHFLVNVNPRYLAEMPYVPVFQGPLWLPAFELGIKISRVGLVYVMPHIGRYVGGDTVGVILSAGIDSTDDVILAVDVGTNGEVVLATKEKLLACSTAAGPAFEGAHIKHGMSAVQGAIDRVLFKANELRIHTVNDEPAIGICGSGLIDAVGELLKLGVIDESGRLLGPDEIDINVPKAIRERIRPIDSGFEFVFHSNGKAKVTLTQKDVREVQLAKGAIAAGIEILLKELCLKSSDISKLVLAGAFGQYIRKDMAVRIGLLPDIPLEKIVFIGNGAYAGAEMALLSRPARARAERFSKQVEYVEISAKTEFQDIFAEKMMFPC